MDKKRILMIILCCLLIFWFGFYTGYLNGREITAVSFQGMPEDAVVHIEIDKDAVH